MIDLVRRDVRVDRHYHDADHNIARAIYWIGTAASFAIASHPVMLGLYGLSIPAGFYVARIDAERGDDADREHYGRARVTDEHLREEDVTTAAIDAFARLWQIVSFVSLV